MNNFKLNGTDLCRSELTQRAYRAASCDVLVDVTPKNREAALAAYRKHADSRGYSGLRISGIADLGFLSEFPLLRYLEILDQKRVNVRQLDGLDNLRGLRLESPGAGLDFSCFPLLEVFVGDWHAGNSNVHRALELRQLRAWQFKPQEADLSCLAGATRLEWLMLTKTNLTSLAGLEALEDLRYFDIGYSPQLESLDALQTPGLQLRELDFEKCGNIRSYEPITSLEWLRRLRISDSAAMPGLQWIRGLNRLDFLSFVGTNVEDGDLSPLLELPRLQYVGTMNKRHYSHKSDEINEVLDQRREESS